MSKYVCIALGAVGGALLVAIANRTTFGRAALGT